MVHDRASVWLIGVLRSPQHKRAGDQHDGDDDEDGQHDPKGQ